MGLFKIDYNKPGKGVEKEDLQKHRFFIFFDVFFRKFMKFVHLNSLYFIFSLPYLILLYAFSPLNATVISTVEVNGINTFVNTLAGEDFEALDMVLRLIFTLGVAIFWGTGPASAGNSYIMRNFAREEHAWVMSDFWDNIKQNFKQSMIVLVTDIVVLYFSLSAFNFYSSQYTQTQNQMFLIFQGILAFVLIIYTFMHHYSYQLMVSFKASMKDIYKTSLILAIAKFPQNIFFTAISLAILVGLFLFISVFAVLAFLFIFISLCKFIIEFYTSEVIRNSVDPE